MSLAETDPRLLLLHPADNVLTIISPLPANESLRIAGAEVVGPAEALSLGHKLARRGIAPGEKIIKYGVPIGSAICRIAAGAHVHTHNLRSDYLPTYLREDHERLYAQQHEL